MKKTTEAECQEALSKGKSSAYVSIAVLEKRAETAEAELAKLKTVLTVRTESWTSAEDQIVTLKDYLANEKKERETAEAKLARAVEVLKWYADAYDEMSEKARACLAELETEKGEGMPSKAETRYWKERAVKAEARLEGEYLHMIGLIDGHCGNRGMRHWDYTCRRCLENKFENTVNEPFICDTCKDELLK